MASFDFNIYRSMRGKNVRTENPGMNGIYARVSSHAPPRAEAEQTPKNTSESQPARQVVARNLRDGNLLKMHEEQCTRGFSPSVRRIP